MVESRQFFQLCPDLCQCDPNCPGGACFLTFIFGDINGKGEQAVGRVLFLKKKIK